EKQFAVIKAATEKSHIHNVHVTIHATELELAKMALHTSTDVLMHSIKDQRVDRKFINMTKTRNVLYITTLIVNEGYDEVFGQNVKLTNIEEELEDPQVIATWSQLAKIPANQIVKKVPPANLRDTQKNQLLNLQLLESARV